jgi:NitT/TauT family transport system permease protein
MKRLDTCPASFLVLLSCDTIIRGMTHGNERKGLMYRKGFRTACVAVFWIILWQATASLVSLPVLLPGPLQTLKVLTHLASEPSFWFSAGASLLRIMMGYALALVFGVVLSILCAGIETAEAILSPLRTLIRSTPITSFIILVLLWINVDKVPIFIAFLTVFPVIWHGVQQGIQQVDAELLEMAKVYKFKPCQVLRYIYLPSVAPHFYASAATGLGFAWKAGIAAEVIAKPAYSIGKSLQDAKVYLQTESLFAWTLVVVLLSLALETLLKHALGKREQGKGRRIA